MTKYAMIVTLLATCAALGGGQGQDNRTPPRGAERPGNQAADAPVLKVAGELTRDDPVSKQRFHKVYPVKLAAGVPYQIDLISKDFDPLLRLEDAQGKPLAEGGVGTDERIVYTAAQSGTYRIIATSFGAAKVGRFVLIVAPANPDAVARQKLLAEANAALLEGIRLYQQAKLAPAMERFHVMVTLVRKAYPKDRYPRGHPDLARSLHHLGSLFQGQGNYGKAEPLYREVVQIHQALYDQEHYPHGHPDLAASLNNLGSFYRDQGEYTKAEALYRAAVQMHQALYGNERDPPHPDLALSLNNLGGLLQAQGEYAKAEPLLRRALHMRQALYPQGHPQLALSLNNLGSLLQAQGEYAKAEPLLRQALAMKRACYSAERYPLGHPDLAIGLYNLGGLLDAKREYAKAEPFYREALMMRQALYPKNRYPIGHPDLVHSLGALGGCLLAQGEYEPAERSLRQALAMCKQLYGRHVYLGGHPQLALSLNNLAGLFQRQGEYAKAEPLGREALTILQGLYPKAGYPQGHPELALSLNNLGVLLHMQGEYAKAEPLCREALTMYTELASRLAQGAAEPAALNAAATFPRVRDSLLSVTGRLSGSDARTYAAVWHSRAALTRVYQRRHLALIAAATDDAVRRRWDELQTLRRHREQLIMAPPSKGAVERAAKLDKLNEQIDTTEQTLATQLPALKYDEDLARLGPDALRECLPANTVLIDCLRYTRFDRKRTVRYLAFVVSRDAVRRVELGAAADIDAAVQQWRAAITAELPAGNDAARKIHEAKLAGQAAALRRLLWAPIEQQLPAGTATVYLAPDGELTQLPWPALPGKGKDRILLEDYALAVLPHGPLLLEQLTPPPPRSAKRPPAADGVLLVGGIRYDDKPSTPTVSSRGAENVVAQKIAWDYLKGTEAERQLLTKLLHMTGSKRTANVSGADATTTRLRWELEHCRYAHLATHGFFADAKFRSILQLDPKLFERTEFQGGLIGQRIGAGARNPLVLSGLVCSGANLPETPERGILSADAIAGLLLDDLHLAVLSACDTGLGDVAGGEGVFGLQRAFHIAGRKNVVASLWKVDDAATAALMTRFYGHLFADGKAPIEALRQAQLDLYRHPELIPAWAKGEARAPGKARPATTPAPLGTPPELVTSAGRTPVRLWAAFTLSGAGRTMEKQP